MKIRISAISSIILLIMLVVLLSASPSMADWQQDGAPVNQSSYDQQVTRIVSDGAGGAIMVWRDLRLPRIYAQRIDPFGNVMWDIDGVPVAVLSGSLWEPTVVADESGGAFIAWFDDRNGLGDDIYAQHMDASGTRLWGDGGVPVCALTMDQCYPVIDTDGAGGCYIVWRDERSGNWDIYAQHLDAAGAPLWTVNGIPICTAAGAQTDQTLTNDGFGDVIFCWTDERSPDWDIYAQHVKSTGTISWTADGVLVCGYTDLQLYPVIVPDGGGGACICWQDKRNSPGDDIYAQRINVAGTLLWNVDGLGICTVSDDQNSPDIVPDGTGGIFAAWSDYRSGEHDIYMQRVEGSGALDWSYNGIPVCDATNQQSMPKLVPHGDGGVIVTWIDLRSGNYDVYAQSVDPYGSMRWAVNGIVVSGTPKTQYRLAITSDGKGGAIIAWEDNRASYYDIYAQRIDKDGYWGIPEPRIRAIRDVPGDQGGLVNISWDASQYDPGAALITQYSVWRAINPEAAMMMVACGARMFESVSELPALTDGDAVRAALLGSSEYYWTLVGTHDAYYLETYSLPTETLFDSTAVSDEYHYFQVIAHTAAPTIFYVSDPDSGYSVDNLAPCPPLALAGEQSFAPEGLELSWAPSTEPDLDRYNIYRGTGPSFDPSPGNLLATVCDTMAFDGGWSWDSGYCYKVAAVDEHGNESEYAVLCAEQVTGDEPMPMPDATFLSQNFPNPFNPSTTIAFGLKTGGFVNLSIYDTAGRLVATLIYESKPAGQYATVWNGKAENGTPAASGVYFYRLIAGEFVETRKMVLLR